MADFDFLDDIDLSRVGTLGGSQPPAKKSRPAWAVANDLAIEAANATVGAFKTGVDVVAPGSAASQAMGDFIEMGEGKQSDATKESKRAFRDELGQAEGFWDEAVAAGKYMIGNPGLSAAYMAGNVAPVGLGVTAASRAAQGVAAARGAAAGLGPAAIATRAAQAGTTAGTVTGAGMGAAMSGGDAAGQTYDELTSPQRRDAVLASPAAQALLAQGVSEDDAIRQVAIAQARKASVVPAVIGAATGATGLERVLAGGKGGGRLMTGLVEGAQGGFEEVATGISSGLASHQVDPSVNPMQGAGANAVMGTVYEAIPGFVLGGNREEPIPESGPLSRAANTAAGFAAGAAAAGSPIQPNQGVAPDAIMAAVDALREPVPVPPQGGPLQTMPADLPQDIAQYISAERTALVARPGLNTITQEQVAGPRMLAFDGRPPKVDDTIIDGEGLVRVIGETIDAAPEYAPHANLAGRAFARNPALTLEALNDPRIDHAEEQIIFRALTRGGDAQQQYVRQLVEAAQRQAAGPAAAGVQQGAGEPAIGDPAGALNAAEPAQVGGEAAQTGIPQGGQEAQAGAAEGSPTVGGFDERGAQVSGAVQAAGDLQGGDDRTGARDARGEEISVGEGAGPSATGAVEDQAVRGAQPQRPSALTPRQQAVARRKRTYADTHPFRAFLATFGVNLSDRADVGGERRQQIMVPYHGVVFRKNGARLDELARHAVDSGFMTQAELDSDLDNGGMNRIAELIQRELSGGRVVPVAMVEADAEAEYEARAQAYYEAQAEAEQAMADLTDDEINALVQIASQEDAEASNEEIDYALGLDDGGQETGRQGAESPAAGASPSSDPGSRAAPRAEGAGEVEPFALGQQTEEDVSRQEAQRRQDEAARERQAAEQARRDAAPPPEEFTLAGSDRVADQAAARGQMELGEAPATEAAPPVSEAQEGNQAAPAAATKPKRTKRAAPDQRIADYFTPGNIVPSYGGGFDRVLEFRPGEDGKWSVKVEAVRKDGDAWVADGGPRDARWHSTAPDQRALAKGPVERAPADEAPKAEAAAGKQAAPIADFGSKIGGARKDVWSSFKDRMATAEGLDVAAEPLSKSWPAPDYQALLDGGSAPWAVAFMHAMRDAVPAKPKRAWKLKAWTAQVTLLRDLGMKALDGETDAGLLRAKLSEAAKTSRGMSEIADRAELYQLVGHEKSLAGVRVSRGEYSLYKGVEYKPPLVMWTVEKDAAATAFSNWPRELANGRTREEALAGFQAAYAEMEISPPAKKDATFEIFSRRGENGYWIGKKIGRNPALLEGPFATIKEARAYKDAHNAELVEKLERFKEIPRERRDTNEPRVGEDMRAGQDVTPDMFTEAFGFNGVEFGNWVEQKRRQKDLNDAYDALMDMAAVLGVSPKALSLNGELGLAFGARGSGGVNPAAAHYEAGKVVINLTKKEGAGSLGHEWWHALDNYFSRMRGKGGDYMTEAGDVSLSARGSEFILQGDAVRKEMVLAFGNVLRAIQETAIRTRSRKLDAKRSKDYWTTPVEMSARAYEAYLIAKLQDQGASNDYLANIVDEATWSAAERLGFELEGSYPYPLADEIPTIRTAFDEFFQTVETRETDAGVAMFSRGNSGLGLSTEAASSIAAAVRKAWANGPEVVVVADMADQQIPQAVRDADAEQRSQGATGEPEGFFYAGRVYLVADQLQSTSDVVRVLSHEALGHYGLRGLFGAELGRILDQISSVRRAEVMAKMREYGLKDTPAGRRVAAEEVLAVMAQTQPTLGFVRRAVAAVRTWLRGLGLNLRMSDAELVRDFILPARAWVERGGGKAALDGASFSRGEAMQQGVPQTETPEFRAWFRDSKVVDADGKPLVVYHGTGRDFSIFDAAAQSSHIPLPGFYFSPDPDIASGFAESAAKLDENRAGRAFLPIGANVVPAYLSLQNPAEIDASKGAHGGRMPSEKVIEALLVEAKNSGHDGAIVRGWTDGSGPVQYVAFRPEQIKSATGNSGAFDPANPDIRFSRSATPDWIAAGNAALRSAAGKIDTFAPRKPIIEKVREMSAGWQDKLIQGMLDAYAPLKKLSMDAYIAARMTKAADGALEGMLMYGKPRMTADGGLVGDLDGKGFLGVMQELNGEHDRFFMWVAGNRARRLAAEGLENLFTADEIDEMVPLDDGQMQDGTSRRALYQRTLRQFNSYQKSVMDIAEQSGLIDGESRKLWEHEFYVPFFRVTDDAEISGPARVKGLVRQKAIERLKGGRDNLGDLMKNTMSNWSHLLSASLANVAAKKSLEAAEGAGVALEAKEAVAKEIAKSVGKKGHAVYFMDQGVQRWFVVDDPAVLTAISALEAPPLGGLPIQVMSKFKRYLTIGVTVSPAFKVRNLIRDTLAAPAVTEVDYNIARNLAEGWKGTDTKTAGYAQMLFSGGLMKFGTYLEGDRAEHVKRLIAAGVKGDTILNTPQKIKAAMGKAWDVWQDFGDRMENINRTALYQQLIDRGLSPRDAAFQARDMMDFSMQGAWAGMRLLTSVVPFLNARAQGLYKMGRAAKENPRRMGYVVGAVAMASIALMLAYQDDDDWKAREDWDRDAFWWIKIGDTAFRIPKPFEVGALGTIAERSVELLVNEEMTGKRFAQRMKNMVSETFAMNPVPQAFKPMLDLYANKDSFTGRQIETLGMEQRSKSERHAPHTSFAALLLGSAGDYTGLSPVQIDHLVRAYFGWLGVQATTAVDVMVSPFDSRISPAKRLADFSGGFVKPLPAASSRYLETFYEQAKVTAEVMADLRLARESGDAEKAAEIRAERGDELRARAIYQQGERQISAINKRIRALRLDNRLDAEAKRVRLDELMALRNEAAKRVTTQAASLTAAQ